MSLFAPLDSSELGGFPITGVFGTMNLVETALFKLAQEGKISIEQAKILNVLCKKKVLSFPKLLEQTGEETAILTIELLDLIDRKMIFQKNELYYASNIEETISQLIHKEIIQEKIIPQKEIKVLIATT